MPRVNVLAAVLFSLWASSHARAQEHPGAEPYRQVCQLCHGENGEGAVAPPLVPGSFDPEYVLAIVREGYGQMPPISTRELSDDQVRQVVAYLASLSENNN